MGVFYEIGNYSINLALIQVVEWDKTVWNITQPQSETKIETSKMTCIHFVGSSTPFILRNDIPGSDNYQTDIMVLKLAMKHFNYPLSITLI